MLGLVAKFGKGLFKHWKAAGTVSFLGYAIGSGKGVGKAAGEVFDFVFNPGDSNGNLAEKTSRTMVDTVFGDGTMDHLKTNAKESLEKAKTAGGEVVDKSREAASDAGHAMSQGVGDGGFVSDLFGGMMNSVRHLFGGGGLGGLNIASALMLPLAWFLFGKFGWIGKTGGLATMMYALSNLFIRQQPSVEQAVAVGQGRGQVQPSVDARENFERMSREQSDGQEYNVRSAR